MKKILAWILVVVLLLGALPAAAEDEVTIYDKLVVATTTPFSGNFLSAVNGNNTSDQDIRHLIHGYGLVYWDSATGSYQFNSQTVSGDPGVSEDGTSFIIPIASNLRFNDGTPITVRDYAFTLLLLGSQELKETTGERGNVSRILGGRDYMEGKTDVLRGFRMLGDHQLMLNIDPEFLPYFYQLKALEITPLPISVIAPGCEVRDDGDGVYIDGDFSADLLEDTLLNPIDGYISHPYVSCGAYSFIDYGGSSVTLRINNYYIGDENGNKPMIPMLVYQSTNPDVALQYLASGRVDLVVRCARNAQIIAGLALVGSGDFNMSAYSRAGLSFISFCGEKGATADPAARQALMMCIDRQALVDEYVGAYGMVVDGYYGIGQWMFKMANGTLIPEEGAEEEWADLTLESIPKYEFDPKAAAQLLEDNGWEMDRDGTLSKAIDGEIVSMNLKLIYPEGNGLGPMLEDMFVPYLREIGIELEIEAMPMPELLKRYYGQVERDCDMILLGTNFNDVFDPADEFDENGKNRLSGITDPVLAELANEMRRTEPGNATEFCRRWLAYQVRLMETAGVIPLYSGAYLDFYISVLRHYEPGAKGTWALPVTEAYLSDFAEEETESSPGMENAGSEDGDLEEFE